MICRVLNLEVGNPELVLPTFRKDCSCFGVCFIWFLCLRHPHVCRTGCMIQHQVLIAHPTFPEKHPSHFRQVKRFKWKQVIMGQKGVLIALFFSAHLDNKQIHTWVVHLVNHLISGGCWFRYGRAPLVDLPNFNLSGIRASHFFTTVQR